MCEALVNKEREYDFKKLDIFLSTGELCVKKKYFFAATFKQSLLLTDALKKLFTNDV